MAPTLSCTMLVAIAALLAMQSAVALSSNHSSRELASCSCDCCEVGRRREEEQAEEAAKRSGVFIDHFECAYSQAPGYASNAPRCDNLCRQDPEDSVVTATSVSEMDSQRFCFLECEPSPSRHKLLQPGDLCRPLSKREKAEVRDSTGNARDPMETSATMHFLANRPSKSENSLEAPKPLSAVAMSSAVEKGAPKVAKPWESISAPISEQVAKVVEWVDVAKKSAGLAGAEAKKVKELAGKASGTMGGVIAHVGQTKVALDSVLGMEKRIRQLRDVLWQRAQKAAKQEVPKIMKEIRAAADKKAEAAAKKKAIVFEKAMKKKAKVESAKAAKVYTDVMAGAGKTAADYAKVGDSLIGQSATLQMNAGLAQGSANQYITIGDMPEAQKLMQQSRSDMNMALSLNGAATGMYDKANKITGQLGAYAGQAAMAAFHAQVMYDPKAVPPPPPLV